MSPDDYTLSIKREMIKKTPHILKTNLLMALANLFKPNALVAGFGNKETDAISYRMVGVPLS